MASSQIKQLQTYFDSLDIIQKKQFIDNLKLKLQGNKNVEYQDFLNSCMKNYNTLNRADLSIRASQNTANNGVRNNIFYDDDVPLSAVKSKQKNPLMGVVIALSIVLIMFLIGGSALIYKLGGFDNIGFKTSNNVVGVWVSKGDPKITLELKKDKSYQVHIYGSLHALSGSEGATQVGKYKVNGGKLILITNSNLSEEYSIKDNNLISGNGNIILEKQNTLDNSESPKRNEQQLDNKQILIQMASEMQLINARIKQQSGFATLITKYVVDTSDSVISEMKFDEYSHFIIAEYFNEAVKSQWDAYELLKDDRVYENATKFYMEYLDVEYDLIISLEEANDSFEDSMPKNGIDETVYLFSLKDKYVEALEIYVEKAGEIIQEYRNIANDNQ